MVYDHPWGREEEGTLLRLRMQFDGLVCSFLYGGMEEEEETKGLY
jgi:hypothetical protein